MMRSAESRSLEVGRWRLTWSRAHEARRSCRLLVPAAVFVALLLGAAVPAAADGPSATVEPTLHVSPPGLRYVQVSGPGGFTSCDPGDENGIGFPNGQCTAGPFEITNGDADSGILVSATDFSRVPVSANSSNEIEPVVPLQSGDGSGDSANWQLCDIYAGHGFSSGAPQCGGPTPAPPLSDVVHNWPGTDQAWLLLNGSSDDLHDQLYLDESATLGPQPVCDVAWGLGNCLAAPDTESTETLQLVGPTVTTDNAYAMWALVTFMAVPGE